MPSKSAHVVANDKVSFFMAEYNSLVYMVHVFKIHSSVDGHLGCFHILAAVDNCYEHWDACVFSN